MTDISYIPGNTVVTSYPLDRYLPPVRRGVVSKWLEGNVPKGSWLLDPFGASAHLPIEAAQRGYRIVVAAKNPITAFTLELMCNPPTRTEFQSAIAMLASSQVGNERLEPHIKSLYETNCQQCGQPIQVDTFLWKRGDSTPYAKIYQCSFCGDGGERSTNATDMENAKRFSHNRLHLARALERVAPLYDPDRRHVEEALDVYLPRSIYALITIINKLNSISTTHPNHRILCALLLLAFDRSNTLWLYPKERQRPKQLIVPTSFREHNIWSSLESAVDLWIKAGEIMPFTKWPDLPPADGGVCLYEGRIKDLVKKLTNISPKAVVTTFPRPNQAFWTLSALWSGWLWGPDVVDNFKSVLRRRRYDWGWHTKAIQSALKSLQSDLNSGTPYFGLIAEVESGFLSAALLGAQLSNLDFKGIAMRVEDEMAQIQWVHSQAISETASENPKLDELILTSTQNYLQLRGEPSDYLYLHAAGLAAIVNHPVLIGIKSPAEYLGDVQSTFQRVLTEKNGFLRYGGSEKSLEVGQWWMSNKKLKSLPLSDRVEMGVVNYLIQNPGSTASEIDTALCRNYAGLSPPALELIHVCLESYALQEDNKDGHWVIQPNDFPQKRHEDIQDIHSIIIGLGKKLGLKINKKDTDNAVVWFRTTPPLKYHIFITASAVLGKHLLTHNLNHQRFLIVLPGSRANLVAYKLKQNPVFRKIADQGWHFIKYRHIRRLADSSTLNLDNLNEQLMLDPLTYSKPQIRLL